MRLSSAVKYVPISACSLMFDGMENTVLDTNFQSALGIFVPVD